MEDLDLIQLENAICFSNSLENEKTENYSNLLNLIKRFKTIYDEDKANLPYHINLIDELHANENAHSRIFAKLLRFKENNKYPFLENFLNEVCKFNVSVEKPEIKKVDSCGRIDIPIFDNKYVVVIENKVTDKASDQNGINGGQLARYIETLQKKYGKELEEIFVIYTPKFTREPSDDCWENKDNFSYKDGFKLRFRSLSYKDVIYPWFKNVIYPWIKNDKTPIIDNKHLYLLSAIEQYVDHLEGMFSLRKIDKEMNMKLQEFIKNELGLQENNPIEAIDMLSEKEAELSNALNQIQQLKSKYQKQNVVNYFEKWEESLKKDYPNLEIVGDKFKLDKNCINIGIKFSNENNFFVALIECNEYTKPNIYVGIGRHYASTIKHETPEMLKRILTDNELSQTENYWYGWKYTSLDNAYTRLKSIIQDTVIKTKPEE